MARSNPAEKASFVRRVRTINAADAPKAAEWINRTRPVPGELAPLLPSLLQRLIAEETLNGVVVEYGRDNDVEPELAAFGLSGFVSEACARDYLASPTPYLEIMLLHRALRDAHTPAFLTYEDIAQANAGEGLTLVPLFWLQRSYDFADPEAHVLLTLGQQTLLGRHRGYRLTRILKEIPAHFASAFMGGGFKEHCRLPANTPLSLLPEAVLSEDHIIFTITRSDMEGEWPGKIIGHLFVHQAPRSHSRAQSSRFCCERSTVLPTRRLRRSLASRSQQSLCAGARSMHGCWSVHHRCFSTEKILMTYADRKSANS